MGLVWRRGRVPVPTPVHCLQLLTLGQATQYDESYYRRGDEARLYHHLALFDGDIAALASRNLDIAYGRHRDATAAAASTSRGDNRLIGLR